MWSTSLPGAQVPPSPQHWLQHRGTQQFTLMQQTRFALMQGSVFLVHRGLASVSRTHVEHGDRLRRLAEPENRPPGIGLLTLSTHTSVFDMAAVTESVSVSMVSDTARALWSVCARDVCFRNPVFAWVFRGCKALPVERGGGAAQSDVSEAAQRLSGGEWVHVFPEGKIAPHREPLQRVRRGVCRLVLEPSPRPIVLPMHSGFADLKPVGTWLPRPGRQVHTRIGEPLTFDDIASAPGLSDTQRCALVTERIRAALIALAASTRDGRAAGSVQES